jgi:hypothetical protein
MTRHAALTPPSFNTGRLFRNCSSDSAMRVRAIVDALKGFDEIVEAVGESKSGSACKQSQAGPGSQAIIRDRYRRDNGHFSIPHVMALVGNRRKSFLVIGSQVSLSGGTSTPDLGF